MRSTLLVLTLLTLLVGCSDSTTSFGDTDADVTADGSMDVDGSMIMPDGTVVLSDAMTDSSVPAPICGNGVTEQGEGCDDSNTVTEACSYGLEECTVCNSACQVVDGDTAFCGDGVTNGTEECDDANTADDDICKNSCERPYPVAATWVCGRSINALNMNPGVPVPCGVNEASFEGYSAHLNALTQKAALDLPLSNATLVDDYYTVTVGENPWMVTYNTRVCYSFAVAAPNSSTCVAVVQ